MKRFEVLDENGRPMGEFDIAIDAVMCRRFNEPTRDAWTIKENQS